MSVLIFPRLSRRTALRLGGLTAGGFAFRSSSALADDVAPIDRGSVSAGQTKFAPIAATNEASEDIPASRRFPRLNALGSPSSR